MTDPMSRAIAAQLENGGRGNERPRFQMARRADRGQAPIANAGGSLCWLSHVVHG